MAYISHVKILYSHVGYILNVGYIPISRIGSPGHQKVVDRVVVLQAKLNGQSRSWPCETGSLYILGPQTFKLRSKIFFQSCYIRFYSTDKLIYGGISFYQLDVLFNSWIL